MAPNFKGEIWCPCLPKGLKVIFVLENWGDLAADPVPRPIYRPSPLGKVNHGHGIIIAPWPQGPTASGPHGLVTPWARGPVALAHGTIVPSSHDLWPMAPSPWTLVSGPWPEWPNRISLFRPPGRIKKIALRRLLFFKSSAPTISLGNNREHLRNIF